MTFSEMFFFLKIIPDWRETWLLVLPEQNYLEWNQAHADKALKSFTYMNEAIFIVPE